MESILYCRVYVYIYIINNKYNYLKKYMGHIIVKIYKSNKHKPKHYTFTLSAVRDERIIHMNYNPPPYVNTLVLLRKPHTLIVIIAVTVPT